MVAKSRLRKSLQTSRIRAWYNSEPHTSSTRQFIEGCFTRIVPSELFGLALTTNKKILLVDQKPVANISVVQMSKIEWARRYWMQYLRVAKFWCARNQMQLRWCTQCSSSKCDAQYSWATLNDLFFQIFSKARMLTFKIWYEWNWYENTVEHFMFIKYNSAAIMNPYNVPAANLQTSPYSK